MKRNDSCGIIDCIFLANAHLHVCVIIIREVFIIHTLKSKAPAEKVTGVSPFINIWQKFVHHFTPVSLRDDPDGSRCAHIIVGLSMAGGVFGASYVLFYLAIGHIWGATVIALCTAAMLATTIVMRISGSAQLAGNLHSLIWTIGFVALSMLEGGVHGHAIAWLACGVPLLALLLLERRVALIWCAICFLATLYFCMLEMRGIELPLAYPARWHGLVTVAGYVGFALFMTLLGIIFESGRKVALAKMTEALRDLSASNERLRNSERFVQRVADATPGLLYMVDLADESLVYANERLRTAFGVPRHETAKIDGVMLKKFASTIDFERAMASLRDRLRHTRDGEVVSTDYDLKSLDGKSHWTCRDTIFSRGLDGEPALVLGIAQNITERIMTERALRDSESRFRELFEGSPDPVYVEDYSGALLDANRAARLLHGVNGDGIKGLKFIDLIPEERRGAVNGELRKLKSGETASLEVEIRAADNRAVQLSLSASRIHFSNKQALLLHARDISEFKQLKEQFLRSQKLEAIGRLAGGVAHDFNNLLTAIIGYNEFVKDRLGPLSDLQEFVGEIGNAADRAAKLTHQLLAFSRKQTLQPRVIDLNTIIGEIKNLLNRIIGEHIELKTIFEMDLDYVKADPGQVEQVIVNLVVNARDAMPTGGTLSIETSNEVREAANNPEVPPGRYVSFTIRDTGVGMRPEILDHVFEPFYTTKPEGKGTGLGLATCYGIVEQSGGHISVVSKPGAGTAFTILLPSVSELPEDLMPVNFADLPTGSETVLLVEDRPEIRRLAASTLREQGYTVIEAENGDVAMRRMAEQSQSDGIDLLLTDVIMPRLGAGIGGAVPHLFSGDAGAVHLGFGVRDFRGRSHGRGLGQLSPEALHAGLPGVQGARGFGRGAPTSVSVAGYGQTGSRKHGNSACCLN